MNQTLSLRHTIIELLPCKGSIPRMNFVSFLIILLWYFSSQLLKSTLSGNLRKQSNCPLLNHLRNTKKWPSLASQLKKFLEQILKDELRTLNLTSEYNTKHNFPYVFWVSPRSSTVKTAIKFLFDLLNYKNSYKILVWFIEL